MSSIMRAALRWLCLAACTVACCAQFAASSRAESYATGNIALLRTGWNADSFGVVLNQPVLNPAHCPIPDGYVSDSGQGGYDTYYEFVLNAYRKSWPITVVIDGTPGACDIGRPRIIGINAAPPPPAPRTETVVLRVSGSQTEWLRRNFSDQPVIGAFTGHGTDCSYGTTAPRPAGPVSGPDTSGPAGWGQIEGTGHPGGNSDPCVSWVAYFGFDFDLTPFTSVPGNKSIDKAILRYNEVAMPACMAMVYTQGGFGIDADIPCWSSGSGAPQDKPEGCVVLRVPAKDLNTVSMSAYWPLTGRKFNKVAPRGAWDVTDLFSKRVTPHLIPPSSAGGAENLGSGYALTGGFDRTTQLNADDNTRCTSIISDVRIELTFTITPDTGGMADLPK